MNVCFVVPDGTGIRNYLFSDLVKVLSENGANIYMWHALTDSAIKEIEKIHPTVNFKSQSLPKYKESAYEKFLRESIAYARLITNAKKVKNETILVNWRKNPKTLPLKIFYKLTKYYGKFLSKKYTRILKEDEKYLNSVNSSSQLQHYKKFLKENKIDTLFCTHQRAVSAIPAMQAGNVEGLKTISAIYSWDNMPKARLNTRSKYYIVWSNYMKEEFTTYYPEIEKSSVVVTGTPQFEFYYDKSKLIEKELFFSKFNLDINKKTICYSGDDRLTSPYDPEYLSQLAETIQITEFNEKVQILLRRAPIDLSGRFNAIVEKYTDIIKVADPIWHFDGKNSKNWTLVYPSMEDISLLINTAYHCDLVYNVGSTMAHDFAMFNKPAAYINYDVADAKKWSTKTIYKYQHFRTQKDLDAVIWINSKEEILSKIKTALNTPNECTKDKQVWLDIIATNRKNASQNIANLILGKN